MKRRVAKRLTRRTYRMLWREKLEAEKTRLRTHMHAQKAAQNATKARSRSRWRRYAYAAYNSCVSSSVYECRWKMWRHTERNFCGYPRDGSTEYCTASRLYRPLPWTGACGAMTSNDDDVTSRVCTCGSSVSKSKARHNRSRVKARTRCNHWRPSVRGSESMIKNLQIIILTAHTKRRRHRKCFTAGKLLKSSRNTKIFMCCDAAFISVKTQDHKKKSGALQSSIERCDVSQSSQEVRHIFQSQRCQLRRADLQQLKLRPLRVTSRQRSQKQVRRLQNTAKICPSHSEQFISLTSTALKILDYF